MKILYLSCHSVLEHDEVKLFTEMGHEVFSFGSYINPASPHDNKRPPIPGVYNDHLVAVAEQCSKEDLLPELIDWADTIYIMHRPDWVIKNWSKMKHKNVVWRSIGQSTPLIENMLAYFHFNGMKVVRYSPMEEEIQNYMGKDAMIRFYKDPDEFASWVGNDASVISIAQSMKKRDKYCGFEIFNKATDGFKRVLFGPDNGDSGFSGGQLSYEDLKTAYRKYRCYFYTGTFPASYTLNFIEAFMTGIPVVSIGRSLANVEPDMHTDTFEIDSFIQNNKNGFISNEINELREYVALLFADWQLATRIGQAGREKAIELFGKNKIKAEWEAFYGQFN